MPEGNGLTIWIVALFAKQERQAISKRTKDALAVGESRGSQLGEYRDDKFVDRTGTAEDAKKASEARTALYRRLARQVANAAED